MLTKDQLLQLLDELPEREPRSRLDPYRELVAEMRRRKYSYREISRFMAERCGVVICHNAVRNFINRHVSEIAATLQLDESGRQCAASRDAAGDILPQTRQSEQAQAVHERIAALKRRSRAGPVAEPGFHFDPAQPLQLPDDTA